MKRKKTTRQKENNRKNKNKNEINIETNSIDWNELDAKSWPNSRYSKIYDDAVEWLIISIYDLT